MRRTIEFQRAADKLLQLAQEGHGGGLAVFTDGGDLVAKHKRPWLSEGRDGGIVEGEYLALVPVQQAYNDDELVKAVEHAIIDGIASRDQAETATLFATLVTRGREEVRERAEELVGQFSFEGYRDWLADVGTDIESVQEGSH